MPDRDLLKRLPREHYRGAAIVHWTITTRDRFDHVLTDAERRDENFQSLCDYIARNPERRQLVEPDCFTKYPFTGCLIPGYPELRPFEPDYWNRLDRIVSRLRQRGLQQMISSEQS